MAVAVALLLVVPLVLGEEVEDVHARILYLRPVSLLAVALSLALPQHGVLVPGRSLGGVRLGMTPPQVEPPGARTTAAAGTARGRRGTSTTRSSTPRAPQSASATAASTPSGRCGSRTAGARGKLALGAPAPAVTGRYGALVTIPCGSYEARVLTRRGVTTAFYVYGGKLWGFGLNRPGASPCH